MSTSALLRLSVLSLVWGSVFLWIKLAGDGFSPIEMVLARLVLGAAVVLAIGFAKRQRLPKGLATWGHLGVAALLGNTLPWLLFAYGERDGSSSIAGILSGTAPVWTMTAAVLLGSEKRLGLGRLGGIALGVLGVVLVSAPWSHDAHVTASSLVSCVLGAVSFGSSFAYVGRFLAPRGIPVFMLAGGQLGTAAVLSALAAPFLGLPAVHASAKATVALIVLGVVCTGFAVLLNTVIITKDGPAASATVVYLMTVVSVVLGGVVLDEPLGWTVIAGTAAVLGATVLLRRRPAPVPAAAAPLSEPAAAAPLSEPVGAR
ncbi:DMT family transporter [Kitasatospora sp. NPDC101183]|uniref:DMT family transporter n=1 Tax=Kitasatospora sp. NPDC101183 TaxID=3364100 RepID=UPI0037F1F195